MAEAIAVVGIGSDERIRAVRVLHPGRIVTLRRCRWILELPIDHPTPTIGDQVDLVRLPSGNPA